MKRCIFCEKEILGLGNFFCTKSCQMSYYNKNKKDYSKQMGNNNPSKRDDVRQKISLKNKGRKFDDKWRKNLSLSIKRYMNDPENRQVLLKRTEKAKDTTIRRKKDGIISPNVWNKGKNLLNDPENPYLIKMSLNRKGKLVGKDNPSKRKEVRKIISDKVKALHKDGRLLGFTTDFARKNIREVLKKYPKISCAEETIKTFLDDNKINYEQQYSYEFGVADFYLSEFNLILECYGTYWHKLPNYVCRDKIKNDYLLDKSFNLLILCSEDVVSDREKNFLILDSILEKIKKEHCVGVKVDYFNLKVD